MSFIIYPSIIQRNLVVVTESYYMININWNQVLTTVISTFLAAIIVGASAVVWKGANSVDEKVQIATENLEDTANYAKAAVDLLDQELSVSRDLEERLEVKVGELETEILNLASALAELQDSPSIEKADEVVDLESVFETTEYISKEYPVKAMSLEVEVPSEYSPIQKRLPKLDLKR